MNNMGNLAGVREAADVAGTQNDDTLTGTSETGLINGLGGNDSLRDSSGGDDQLFGGDGNDVLLVERGFAFTNPPPSQVVLDGGAGDDRLTFNPVAGSNGRHQGTLRGGDGNDSISTFYSDGTVIDGGTGMDRSVSLGADADVLRLTGSSSSTYFAPGRISVSDFRAGEDRLAFADHLRNTLFISAPDPFASGHLRLAQSGRDAFLQIDRNGAANGEAFVTLIIFRNLDARTLTPPSLDGFTPGLITVLGTEGDDRIFGTGQDDRIEALGGNDFIDGGYGRDRLRG